MFSHLLTAGLLGGLAAASNSSYPADQVQTGTPPCDALIAAGLRNRVLLPTDSGYEPQIETWYAKNARYHPWCLVLPQNTAEVSRVLTTLVEKAGDGAGDWAIALRSGSHGPAGINNIYNGVTVDLSHMNASTYDKEANTAGVQPGARWRKVYTDLDEYGVTVVGGRDGSVGVGGFLLGGGISYFSGRQGLGCDGVVNYELVLGNGTVANANATANADLWRALKGGGSNFGIVTRYDLAAIPSRNMTFEQRYLDGKYSDQVVDAVVDFSNHAESFPDDALVTWLMYNGTQSTNTTSIGVIHVNTAGNENSTSSFDMLRDIPASVNVSTQATMAELGQGGLEGGQRTATSTRTFKNNPDILRYCVKLHDEYVESLKHSVGAENFVTGMFLQPFPAYEAQISKRRGGNMLGLDSVTDNAVLWTGGVEVHTDEAALTIAQAQLYEMEAKIASYAKSVGGDLELVYMNYANPAQDPLGSYGADNIRHLREVAAKYDPAGVFQTRVPKGFKIGRVA